MFEKGDLVCEKEHPARHGFIVEVLHGKMSDRSYLEIRWLNFPWGNPHTRTLELPVNIRIMAKANGK
jgi:hypothetical protein